MHTVYVYIYVVYVYNGDDLAVLYPWHCKSNWNFCNVQLQKLKEQISPTTASFSSSLLIHIPWFSAYIGNIFLHCVAKNSKQPEKNKQTFYL